MRVETRGAREECDTSHLTNSNNEKLEKGGKRDPFMLPQVKKRNIQIFINIQTIFIKTKV